MVPYLIATAAILLFVALVCWLIQRSLNRQRRERELLRPYSPDFSDDFWNRIAHNADASGRSDGVPFGVPFADADADQIVEGMPVDELDEDCLPTFDNDVVELEPVQQVEHTAAVEPSPIFGTRVTVRQSYMRAVRHLERCSKAAFERHDYAEAEAFARAALREVNLHMKRDHWYAPHILCWLGYLRYEQGFTVEGKEIWEHAEQVALEWHEQCHDILPVIQKNLQVFYDNF